ncbi:putative conserved membrane protein [Synechococcus sp. A18-25c]|uniref:hypothetical protein n=1 Tax=Synechococcus sp. A18-25c TaxID=1866938 RepID=UPI000C655431|nr:hypothetical protein [Synechococcus sp. A18-25c]MAN19376.1 hypothetical protein [Synechococcus sp. EAC657]MEC7248796.1 hypothetical protein [Cyanobacteriota bacterium]MEC7896456.1 hypothetical protein [Cyanobacteriota bacterium]QNJ20836.1 putative conserved membrane protein [Synechococcus sp. A18-25c]
MIPYLIVVSLLVPANLWAAITPHLHSDLSMRLLHGISTAVLLPPLWSLWRQRQRVQKLPAVLLASFAVVLVVVNCQITVKGMGVQYGWVDHLFLAMACVAVLGFYLLSEPDSPQQREQRTP